MKKIYTIWFLRYVLPILSVELIVLSAIVIGIRSQVFVGHVLNNITVRALHYPLASFGRFWVATISNMEIITQVLLAAGFVVSWFVARDALRVSRQFRGNFLRIRRVS